MNFVRSRLSIGNFIGQRCRNLTETWSHRGMCNKPQEVKEHPLPEAPAKAASARFRPPGYSPTEMDKKILVWSGRFKTVDQIPELVSSEMISAARNKFRVKVCYVMIVATIAGCVVMVVLGKRAIRRNESLTGINMEKKAKWREDYQREKEAAVALTDKTQ